MTFTDTTQNGDRRRPFAMRSSRNPVVAVSHSFVVAIATNVSVRPYDDIKF